MSLNQDRSPEKKMDESSREHAGGKSGKNGAGSAKRKKIAMGVGALALVGATYFLYQNYFYVSTDNATVQASTTLLSSRITGIVTKALVQENEKVKKGQVLVEIRPDDYRNVVDQSRAEIEALQAQVKGAQANYQRTLGLFKQGASTKERLDDSEAQFKALEGRLKGAEAQASQAELNLDYTKVVAPADGKIGRKSFEVGMLASPGQPLVGFVEGSSRWVVANLKETDMDHITVGKKAFITVDAISGKEFEGEVESISPTTGATFSLLPPDNATGNFTKVVQRVPVRVKLLNLSENDIDRLQAGLSAVVRIRVH